MQFFLAPSLTTGKGELKLGSGFDTRTFIMLDGGQPTAELELRYETAATLLLRGILKRDNPAHRAILQQFPGGGSAAPGCAYMLRWGRCMCTLCCRTHPFALLAAAAPPRCRHGGARGGGGE